MKTNREFCGRGVCAPAVLVLLLAAATAAPSCGKEEAESSAVRYENPIGEGTLTDTRAFYDPDSATYYWTRGDRAALLYIADGAIDPSFTGTADVVEDRSETFDISFDRTPSPAAGEECRLAVVYPHTSLLGASGRTVRCLLPAEQHVSSVSFQTDLGIQFGMTESASGALPASREFPMRQITAYGEMRITPPVTLAADERLESVRFTAQKPLAGSLSFNWDDSEPAVADDAAYALDLKSLDGEFRVNFTVIPADLSRTPISVTIRTSAGGRYTISGSSSNLPFVVGRRCTFPINMSKCVLTVEAGDVLWYEDFESAEALNNTDTVRAGEVVGSCDPAADDASCRLFGGGDRSGIVYTGSWGVFNYYEGAPDERFFNKVFTHKGTDGYVEFDNIPLLDARRVKLTFGTNATTCTVETAFDGVWGAKESLKVSDGALAALEKEVPEGASTISFRICGNTKLARRYDNFTLTVAE